MRDYKSKKHPGDDLDRSEILKSPDIVDPDEEEMEQVAEDLYAEMMIEIREDKHVIHDT